MSDPRTLPCLKISTAQTTGGRVITKDLQAAAAAATTATTQGAGLGRLLGEVLGIVIEIAIKIK